MLNYLNIVPIIKGKITFEKEVPSFLNATLYVYLENTSFIDAASKVVADYMHRNVNVNPEAPHTLSFELAYTDLHPKDSFAIRVHIDIDNDGKVSKGDFINMQSYPVITFGYPMEVSIEVKQIK